MPGCARQPLSTPKASSSDPGYQSASELADAIKARKVSSVEVVDHLIARIEKFDPALNAVVVHDFERAREAAKAPDATSQGGDRRPLFGVPIVVKESFNVTGLATTRRIPQQKNFIAKEDAVVIARLKSAFGTRRIEIDGKNYSYRDAGIAWAEPATTPGLPATVMPVDRSDDGLPIGMRIIGPFPEDRTPITFAALAEQRFGGFVPPPGYT